MSGNGPLTGPCQSEHDGKRGLYAKVDGEYGGLEGAEGRSREGVVGEGTVDEGLEEVGAEEGAVGEDVVGFRVGERGEEGHFGGRGGLCGRGRRSLSC